jgi:hypothetical protein
MELSNRYRILVKLLKIKQNLTEFSADLEKEASEGVGWMHLDRPLDQ